MFIEQHMLFYEYKMSEFKEFNIVQTVSVYLNPRASNGHSEYWKNQLNQALFRSELVYRSPWSRQELDYSLDQDIENKVDAVVSVGGDGTVNTLIQKMSCNNIGLLLVPAGTANDLASEMGCLKDIRNAIQSLRQEKFQKIDLIDINGQFMATNGGLGLGGAVGEKINYLREKIPLFKSVMRLSGDKIYQFFIAQELLSTKFDLYDFEIEANGQKMRIKSPGVFISNQPNLGGSFQIAPQTNNSDGLFNVMILKHQTRGSLIRFITKMATGGTPLNNPDCICFETSKIRIKNHSSKDAQCFGDGETFNSSKEFNISVVPKGLKVFSQKDNTLTHFSNGLFS